MDAKLVVHLFMSLQRACYKSRNRMSVKARVLLRQKIVKLAVKVLHCCSGRKNRHPSSVQEVLGRIHCEKESS